MAYNPSTHQSSAQTAADYIRQMLNTHMNTTELSLDFKTITDLLPLIHLISSFKRLKKLSLHGNRLKQLPTDLSNLKNLQHLDISNNFLDDNVQLTLLSLKTIPNLKNLTYPVPPQKQQKIVQELKTLQYFNNVKIQRQKAKQEFVFNLLNKKSMEEYEKKLSFLYKVLLDYENKYLDQKPQKDAIEKFQFDIQAISKDFLDKLARSKDQASPSLQYVMLYMARYQMFQQLIIKALNLCQDIYSDMGDFIFKLYQQQGDLFKSLAQQSLSLTRLEYDVKQQAQQQKRLSQQNGQYAILNKNLTMQKQIKRLRKQKQDLITQLNQVQSQNKKLMQTLTKYAKGDKGILSNFNGNVIKQGGRFGVKSNFEIQNQHQHSIIQKPTALSNKTIPLPTLRSNEKNQSMKTQNFMKQSQNFQSNSYNNYSTGGGGNRNLTLKQLKETIEEIYQSKLKFDQKNYDGKIARQTMHQYLFTYLNQKYGLKNLTIEAAASIVSGIQAYSTEDNDICVFGKILRNQVDQQFRFVQTELKTTVTDLLKMHVKTKMPYRSATEVNQILNQKMNNQITWQQSQDIVKYLYNKQDSEAIIKKLDILFKINEKPAVMNNKRLTREQQAALLSQKQVRKLRFSHFLKCVLDFQLKNHQKLLKPLIRSFKQKDSDSDGVINQQQFIAIVHQLCTQGNEIVPYLLNIVDPYELKQITFTQMVRLVANYPQSSPILSRFIGKQDQGELYGQHDENGQRRDEY